MKVNDKILTELNEVIQYFINHKDNEPKTEFCSNVDKLINLQADLANGVNTENEPSINYDGLLGTVPDNLFGNECRNHKCVYNVAATCKNRDIGKACKGHCA